MPAWISVNSIVDPEIREKIAHAVAEAFAGEPECWHVVITEERHLPGWGVELLGPGAYYWQRKFFGPQEQDVRGEFIARTLKQVIAKRRERP